MSSALIASLWLWLAFIVTWFAAAIWADRATRRATVGDELGYRLVTTAAYVLLFGFWRRPILPLWWTPWSVQWALVGVEVVGFAFCWWARVHLGRLWSANVTRKADHHVVDTGPYRLVRHPIYTGILLATLAIALMEGSGSALVGFALAIVAFWMKARLEERFLRSELGPESYDVYAARTPMLVPFAPR